MLCEVSTLTEHFDGDLTSEGSSVYQGKTPVAVFIDVL